jgi:hypothetical protein
LPVFRVNPETVVTYRDILHPAPKLEPGAALLCLVHEDVLDIGGPMVFGKHAAVGFDRAGQAARPEEFPNIVRRKLVQAMAEESACWAECFRKLARISRMGDCSVRRR